MPLDFLTLMTVMVANLFMISVALPLIMGRNAGRANEIRKSAWARTRRDETGRVDAVDLDAGRTGITHGLPEPEHVTLERRAGLDLALDGTGHVVQPLVAQDALL